MTSSSPDHHPLSRPTGIQRLANGFTHLLWCHRNQSPPRPAHLTTMRHRHWCTTREVVTPGRRRECHGHPVDQVEVHRHLDLPPAASTIELQQHDPLHAPAQRRRQQWFHHHVHGLQERSGRRRRHPNVALCFCHGRASSPKPDGFDEGTTPRSPAPEPSARTAFLILRADERVFHQATGAHAPYVTRSAGGGVTHSLMRGHADAALWFALRGRRYLRAGLRTGGCALRHARSRMST